MAKAVPNSKSSSKKVAPSKRSKAIQKAPETPKFTRPGKVDFTSQRKAHTALMTKSGCNVDKMIKLRQQIHSWPEGRFEEFKTQQLIFDTLVGLGIDKK